MVLGLNEELEFLITNLLSTWISGARSTVCNVYDTESKEQGPGPSELITVKKLQKKRTYKTIFVCVISTRRSFLVTSIQLSSNSSCPRLVMCSL
ncbi:unnamed protein product [Brassica rapa subsp. trilocularis]